METPRARRGAEPQRMKIGALNFFPAFTPPRSGGELRYYHLYIRLGQWHDVEMINPTYPDHARERIEHGPRVTEHRFPKTQRYLWWHHTLGRLAGFKECSAFVCGLSAPHHAQLRAEAQRLWLESDVLIHEFPYLFSLAPRPRSGQLMIYDAHNVEYRLAREMFPGAIGRWAARKVRTWERRCARAADVILACSDEDAAELAALYRVDPLKIRVVPNGVDPGEIRPAEDAEREAIRSRLGLHPRRRAVLFFGSYHPPNIEAVEYLCAMLAPVVPDADFVVAGRVCRALEGRRTPPNVRVLGAVEDDVKRDLLQGCDAAVNPMFTGSGTNLKMLEYLAAGLPTVTTARGARGLRLEDRRHALVAEERDLARSVKEVACDAALRRALAREGRDHVTRNYTWDAIARSLHDLLLAKTGRRVLLLNDFPATPSRSGGQARLLAMGRRLAETGHGVTILTLAATGPARAATLAAGLEEINVPRSRRHRWIDLLLSHQVGLGVDDASAYLFTRLTPRFARVLRHEARLARAAIFSHCYMISMRRLLPPGVVVVHDAHNAETDLKRQLYGSGLTGRWLGKAVRRAEAAALRQGIFTACVSDEVERILREQFPGAAREYVQAPNGVQCGRSGIMVASERRMLRRAAGLGSEPFVVFLASGHPPNAEAGRFIIDFVAPHVPEATFVLIGQVCGWFVSYPCPSNVILLGIVPEEVKDFLLQVSDLAVNPMFQGSGTNLKMFDYLAAGVPVVTTPTGARGIEAGHEGGLTVCDAEAFASEVARLLQSPGELERRALRSYELALGQFDWSVTLKAFLARLDRELDGGAPTK